MKKFIKIACLCFCIGLGSQVIAQTITTNIALQRFSGGALTVATNTLNTGDVVAFPWLPNATFTSGTAPVAFTINPASVPTGATNWAWTVKGDIYVTGGGGNTIVVGTGNRNGRLGSSGVAIPSDLGQSKARLLCTYTYTPVGTGGACTGVVSTGYVTIDLLKQFNNTTGTNSNRVPPVVGPVCLQPNTEYTYSVDPIVSDNITDEIGIDKYKWEYATAIVNGGSLQYTSIDKSSITIKTGSSVPLSALIRCYFGEVNTPPVQTTANLQAYSDLTVQSAIGTPTVTLSGTAAGGASVLSILPSNNINLPSSCIKTVTGGAGALTFTVTQQPGATYQWTFGTYGSTSNGWNTTVPQVNLPYTATGNSFTVANIFNQPGTVTLRVTSTCGSVTDFVYTINRTLTAASSGLITLSSNCTPQGTGITATLLSTGNGAANLNNVSWSVNTNPTNWSFPGGAGSFTLTPNATTPVATYSLTPNFNGCPGTASYSVSVRPGAVTLSSPTSLCIPRPSTNFGATFLPAGTTQYSYSISGTGNSVTTASGTSNVASINRTVAALAGTITANYIVAAGCTTTSAAISILTPAVVPASFTLPTCVGGGTSGITALITIGSHPGVGTYTLTFVSGTNILSSLGPFTPNASNQITVPINGAVSGIGTYTMVHTVTGCGSSTSSASFILDNITAAPSFTSIVTQGANKLLIPSEAANWTYFNCTSGAPLTINASNSSNPVSIATNPTASWLLTVAASGATNQFGFQGTAANGCIYRSCTLVNNYSNRPGKEQLEEKKLALPEELGKIYPNPNEGIFSIYLANETEGAKAVIIDLQGKEVGRVGLKKGENLVNDLNLIPGNYTVVIWHGRKVYANKIIVR